MPWLNPHKRTWVFLAFISFIGLLLSYISAYNALLTEDHPNYSEAWDHHKYRYMAENGVGNFHIAPFAYRIGWPWFLSIFPGDLQINAQWLTLLFLWLTLLALTLLLRSMKFRWREVYWAILAMLSIGMFAKFQLAFFWLVDPLLFFLFTLSLWANHERRNRLLVFLLVLGTLVKENMLFLLPIIYLSRATSIIDFKIIRQTVILGLLPIITFLSLRWITPARNNDLQYLEKLGPQLTNVHLGGSEYDYWSTLTGVLQARLEAFEWTTFASFYIFAAFPVFLVVLALIGTWQQKHKSLPWLILIGLSYLQLLFAMDTARLLVLAFPAMIILSLYGICYLEAKYHYQHWILWVPPATLFCFLIISAQTAFGFQQQILQLILSSCLLWLIFAFKKIDRS